MVDWKAQLDNLSAERSETMDNQNLAKEISDMKKKAKDIKEYTEKNRKGKIEKKEVNYTQMRKFYDEILKLYNQGKKRQEKFQEEVLPLLKLFVAKAYYAKGRDVINKPFLDFIKRVESVKTFSELKNFKTVFEALLGYYKFYKPK